MEAEKYELAQEEYYQETIAKETEEASEDVDVPNEEQRGEDDELLKPNAEEIVKEVEKKKEEKTDQDGLSACRFPALVCFLCHDAVEKCLKGLMYAKSGLPTLLVNESCLMSLNHEIECSYHITTELKEAVEECVLHINEHRNISRYPHYQIPPCAPASLYTSLEAMEALRATKKLIEKINEDKDLCELFGALEDLPEQTFRFSLLQPNNSK